MNQEEMEQLMNQSGLQNQTSQNNLASAQQQYFSQEQEKTTAEIQLDVNQILENTYHKLRQDVLIPLSDGKLEWKPILEKDRALTEWGVNRIMQVIEGYVNKNTLLSNFDDKQIDRIMLQFISAMNGLMLQKYEFLFRQPSFEECKEILQERLAEKRKLKMFTAEVLGQKVDEKKIEAELLKEVEKRIEQEIQKIREEQRKQKLREYEVLFAQLDILILSTLQRAWKGEERGSLRRHTNISEVIGKMQSPQQKGGMFNLFK